MKIKWRLLDALVQNPLISKINSIISKRLISGSSETLFTAVFRHFIYSQSSFAS